ncbi:MAG: hypothetical protein EOP06_09315 [Proteobacteria bacterium]|nr:MAG: hypothetical protein EOP06_09315 [Pseudomonadota bacterium]
MSSGFTNGSVLTITIRGKRTDQNGSVLSNTVELLPLGAFLVNRVTEGVKQITLDWSTLAGASAYQVFYKKSSDAAYASANVGNVNSYTVSGLTEEVPYDFYVKATGALGATKDTPVVHGTPFGKFSITSSDDSAELQTIVVGYDKYADGFTYKLSLKMGAVETFSSSTTELSQKVAGLAVEESIVVTAVATKGTRVVRSRHGRANSIASASPSEIWTPCSMRS